MNLKSVLKMNARHIMTNMKTLFSGALVLGMALSCTQMNEVNYNIITGTDLYAPADGAYVDLSTGAATVFEWEPSVAEDNGYVAYEVLFDREGGDFSNPVAAVTSNLTGSATTLSISSIDMDDIVEATGVGIGATGKVWWTVRASKGLEGNIYPGHNSLEVTRVNIMEPLPVSVTLAGAGTEDPDNGIAMVPSDGIDKAAAIDGCFECFTRLGNGEFTVCDDLGRYYILNDNGTMTYSEEPVTNTLASGEGIYWLSLTFDGMVWTADKVSKVQLQASSSDVLGGNGYPGNSWKMFFDMTYEGKGVWVLKDYENTMSIKKDGTAGDSRHRMNMTLADGTTVYLGTEAGLGSSYTTDYLKVHLYTDKTIGNADWDKSYNFLSSDCGRPLDLYLYMNGDNPAGTWYHEYKFK